MMMNSMINNEPLVIEPLEEANIDSANTLFYEAFSSKFKTIHDMPEAQRQGVLSLFWQRGLSDPYDRHFQVKLNGKLVAVYGMTYGVKRIQEQAPTPVPLIQILHKAGFFRFMKIWRIFQLFVHKPRADTAYLSYLCVDNKLRAMGIGNRVLDHIETQAAADPKLTRVSLYVSDLNTKARELYLRRGYIDEKYETSRTTLRYMDIYGWHYMVKELAS
ncbi:GNAT family N-acetyltransferase [Providencia alcalifaciens]|uniref:GNAT family N-acetyltransferase n=1 Tax=Providencia alcalifaciens TaxID=126385 RepID=UPI002AA0B817|nr:GNAT family N-acetyltransferase [Providencia alcalifaciens]